MDPLVRPSGHPERYCAYHSVIGATEVHFHSVAELTLVLHGTGTGRIGGQQFPLQRGTLSLALPNVPHNQDSDQIGKYVCMFDMGLVEPLLARDPIIGHVRAIGIRCPAVQLSPADAVEDFTALFRQLLAEYASPLQPGTGAVVGALLTQLLVGFVRSATSSRHGPPLTPEHAPHGELAKILRYVQDHFTEPINRSAVAKALKLRPETVSRVFSQRCGESFSSYLGGLRIGHALELLQSTDLSAVEISRLSGFDSYRTFARALRARYGRSPSDLRDSLGG